jgi:hypothetical protein
MLVLMIKGVGMGASPSDAVATTGVGQLPLVGVGR